MQEGRTPIPYRQINRELLVSILRSPKWFAITVTILGLIVLGGFAAAGLLVNKGFGVTGLNRPVMWGFFITNFVFWIGISHAGVMLSAILRLSKAEWRRPATRRRRDPDRLLAYDGHDDAPDSYRAALAHHLLDLHHPLHALRLRPGASGPTCARPWSGTPRRSTPT